MLYQNIRPGIFKSRPNRFIALVEIAGQLETVHVKNTGRCKEILIPGCQVMVQEFSPSKRRTNYDLIGAFKEERLINIDSQAPNLIFKEYLEQGNEGSFSLIKQEVKYKNSRFDFYLENAEAKIFAEVKGVTLEHDNVAMFPDAPTQRGVKHLYELCSCVNENFQAWIVFIIQMNGIAYFTPERHIHPEFAQALKQAAALGVRLMALDCVVGENSIVANKYVDIML